MVRSLCRFSQQHLFSAPQSLIVSQLSCSALIDSLNFQLEITHFTLTLLLRHYYC